MQSAGIHIRYLLHDVLRVDATTVVENELISIHCEGRTYNEPVFDFENPQLTKHELEQLSAIAALALHDGHTPAEVIREVQKSQLPCLKIIHFFINEHYLDKNAPKDNHGRQQADTIDVGLLVLLQVPMADILSIALMHELGINRLSKTKLMMSCDYDILNIWHSKGFAGSVKRLMKWVLYIKPITFFKELYSFFFSGISLSANYLLTSEMLHPAVDENKYDLHKNAFFLVHSSHPNDFDNDFNNPAIRAFIQQLSREEVHFGLHPSYETLDKPALLPVQVKKFATLFGKAPLIARFHYLRCNYPDVLTLLEESGIEEDHSFYFAKDARLFRGGTTRPFNMWNTADNRPFPVNIFPITIMEGSLDMYMQLDYDAAYALCERKIKLAAAFGGYISLLWHNTEIYYGQTEPGNYQYRLFKALESGFRNSLYVK